MNDQPIQLNANLLTGPSVIFQTFAVSSRTVQPSVIEHGSIVVGTTSATFVTFPQSYSTSANLNVLLTPNLMNHCCVTSIVTSGFSVSGNPGDTLQWLSMGFK